MCLPHLAWWWIQKLVKDYFKNRVIHQRTKRSHGQVWPSMILVRELFAIRTPSLPLFLSPHHLLFFFSYINTFVNIFMSMPNDTSIIHFTLQNFSSKIRHYTTNWLIYIYIYTNIVDFQYCVFLYATSGSMKARRKGLHDPRPGWSPSQVEWSTVLDHTTRYHAAIGISVSSRLRTLIQATISVGMYQQSHYSSLKPRKRVTVASSDWASMARNGSVSTALSK